MDSCKIELTITPASFQRVVFWATILISPQKFTEYHPPPKVSEFEAADVE